MVAIRHTWDKELRMMVTIKSGGHTRKEFEMMTSFESPYIMKPVGVRGDSLILPYFEERGADGMAGYCTERTAWKFLHDIASALAHIHGKGYAHNDVKPSSVLIGQESFVLSSFGACSRTSGTADAAAGDIWSLGAAVFHMMTGMEIFNGRTQKKETVIPALRKDLYSGELSVLMARCLAFEPDERPDAETIAAEAARMMKEGRIISKSKPQHKPEGKIPFEEIWPEAMTI